MLAYGQTGSGKTHSMGTAYKKDAQPDLEGVIPRYYLQKILKELFRFTLYLQGCAGYIFGGSSKDGHHLCG